MVTQEQWSTDILPGFVQHKLSLPTARVAPGEPADTDLNATLVTAAERQPGTKAVLYLHGWNDYFFQTHLAQYWQEQGYQFFALDWRRSGRSVRRGQFLGYIEDLFDYDLEIDQAVAIITAQYPQLTLMAHSTGGLVGALWANRHPGVLQNVILNSPWLDFQGSALSRAMGPLLAEGLSLARLTTRAMPVPDLGLYERSLLSSEDGDWEFDQRIKGPRSGSYIRPGWLRAILRGQRIVRTGLDIDCPVLMLTSSRSASGVVWDESFTGADIVLDVTQMRDLVGQLGSQVTLIKIPHAIHDVILSRQPVRDQAFAEISQWLLAYGAR